MSRRFLSQRRQVPLPPWAYSLPKQTVLALLPNEKRAKESLADAKHVQAVPGSSTLFKVQRSNATLLQQLQDEQLAGKQPVPIELSA